MWRKLKRWGWLALVAGGALLGLVLYISSRGRVDLGLSLKAEKEALDAEERFRRLEAEHGREVAIEQARKVYSAELETADERAKARIEKYSHDPGLLARELVRTGARLRRERTQGEHVDG